MVAAAMTRRPKGLQGDTEDVCMANVLRCALADISCEGVEEIGVSPLADAIVLHVARTCCAVPLEHTVL